MVRKEIEIRAYCPGDRQAVRDLCCNTGYLGKPIDPIFEDRELFADYLTSYYTDVEPESCFVVVLEGEIKGYLIGCRRHFRQKVHDFFLLISLAVRVVVRYRRYRAATREYISWILRDSWREIPAAPPRTPHFHFNIYPEARGIGTTAALMERFFDHLRQHGERAVFGQIVTFESRRTARALERYGFHLLEKKRLSKWDGKHPEPVYLCTVLKKLE